MVGGWKTVDIHIIVLKVHRNQGRGGRHNLWTGSGLDCLQWGWGQVDAWRAWHDS